MTVPPPPIKVHNLRSRVLTQIHLAVWAGAGTRAHKSLHLASRQHLGYLHYKLTWCEKFYIPQVLWKSRINNVKTKSASCLFLGWGSFHTVARCECASNLLTAVWIQRCWTARMPLNKYDCKSQRCRGEQDLGWYKLNRTPTVKKLLHMFTS